MSDTIDYGNLMHDAMRGLIRTVLGDVARHGLPGDHHFFITFSTMHPDVEIADWLSDRFPEEMTVVMQHWFEDLHVTDEGFSVTLNFGDNPESLYIPYDAILTFVDPSVEFGLRFETQHDDEQTARDSDDGQTRAPPGDAAREAPETGPAQAAAAPERAPGDAEVVSLDSFRK